MGDRPEEGEGAGEVVEDLRESLDEMREESERLREDSERLHEREQEERRLAEEAGEQDSDAAPGVRREA